MARPGEVDLAGPKPRLDDLAAAARARGVDLTEPRLAVLEALLALATHPTADEVLAQATRLRPGIGRATVYRALDQLTEAGLLSKACHPGAAVRYDVRPERHHHLVCVRCERIVDISDLGLDAVQPPDVAALGFQIHDVQVHVRGLCRECRERDSGSMTSESREKERNA